MDEHGFKISVYSEGIGTGCTFTILLPVYKKGNEKIEAMNREVASTISRRQFISKFLENKVQGGDLDLVPHGTYKKKMSLPHLTLDDLEEPPVVAVRTGFRKKGAAGHQSGRQGRLRRFGSYVLRIADGGESVEDVSSDASRQTLGYEQASEHDSNPDEAGPELHGRSSVILNLALKAVEEEGDEGLASARDQERPLRIHSASDMQTLKERLLGMANLFILVVDDSALNRKMLVKLLEGRGHKCEESKNGLEALQKVSALRKGHGCGWDLVMGKYPMSTLVVATVVRVPALDRRTKPRPHPIRHRSPPRRMTSFCWTTSCPPWMDPQPPRRCAVWAMKD